MANQLTDIELTEISLVDTGANPGAKVALFKRDDDAGSDVIEKCLTAVRKEQYRAVSKNDYADALDQLARRRVDHFGESFPTAYMHVAQSAEGKALYDGYTMHDLVWGPDSMRPPAA